jgi:hypothetical protein
MTFDELCEIEPGLRQLEAQIRAVDDSDPHFYANREWYRNHKPVLLHLAGWYARCPDLRSVEAYDVAYGYLYDLLPDCRDCACL